jgi:hypothetical protein
VAIDSETIIFDPLGECSSDIGKGIFGRVPGRIPANRRFRHVCAIDPSDGCGGHAEMQVIDDCVGIASLCLGAADLLLDLPKSGLDLPVA